MPFFTQCDAQAAPEPLPDQLAMNRTPRPWGDTFLPKSNTPAQSLLLVDARPLPNEVKTALACLQGLTSREQPRMWVHFSGRDPAWLDWHKEKGYISGYETVADWKALFQQFKTAYKGAVIPDPDLYRGSLLAANVAACEDLIIATPELAESLGIPVVVDLRGRFSKYSDGMQWVWDTYKDRLSHHLSDFLHPDRLPNGAFAYDMQWKAVMFWIAGPVDSKEPGADILAETAVMAKVLSEMVPNTAVLGFPFAGEGVGMGEPAGVDFVSGYGIALVCTDSLANTCVMSGVRIDKLKQNHIEPPALEKDKIYIAMDMSDGDNQNCWIGFFKPYFEHPDFGKFPVAFGMGPPIMDLMPAVAQWYFEHATPNTEFMADVSGIGYTHPEHFGAHYQERGAVMKDFFDWTARYLDKLDMSTLRTVGGKDPVVTEYVEGMPKIHSLFADMGRYSGREGIKNLTYMIGETPVFRAVTSWRYGKDTFMREVREQVGDVRPAFVNGFLHCWTYDSMDAIVKHIYEQRDPDMVFVTPSQLAVLYKEAKVKGWTE